MGGLVCLGYADGDPPAGEHSLLYKSPRGIIVCVVVAIQAHG